MIKEERIRARKRKRRTRGALVTLAVLIFTVAALVTITLTCFKVKNVVVEGNELYDDETISAEVLNDKHSDNALYVFFKYRFKKLDDVPFIDTMSVSLDNPNTVHITVYEKGLLGYLYDEENAQNVYFDKDGIVVEISDRSIEGVPEIRGLVHDEITLYKKLTVDSDLLAELLTLTTDLKREEMLPDTIIYGDTNSPILVYGNVRVQVGSTELLTLKLEHLEQILPQLSGESGVLHLEDWTEDSANIIFDRDN